MMLNSRRGKVRRMNSDSDFNRFSHSQPSRRPTPVLERFPRYNVGERVYVPEKNRYGTVQRVEFDPKWGPQLLVTVSPNDDEVWVEEDFWFQYDRVTRTDNRTRRTFESRQSPFNKQY